MDAWLAATVAIAIAGLAAWLVWWAVGERRERRLEQSFIRAEAAATGASLGIPSGRRPAEVRGRGDLVLRLVPRVPGGGLVVLAGIGGVGKSTVAAEVARRARVPRPLRRPLAHRAWWISGATATSLTAGVVAVARRLGASRADLEAIDGQSADAPDRLWALLDRAPRGWLLVIDDADDPGLLAAPRPADGAEGARVTPVADGTGWVRSSTRGLVIVTSRLAEQATWGSRAVVHRLSPLSDADAGCVLRDHAPAAGDQPEAETLGRQLGGLPLALHLAGLNLAAGYGPWATFDAYREALDRVPAPTRLLDADSDVELDRGRRAVVMRTAELSLDALAEHGLPEARALLRLLSCYQPAFPIPVELLRRAALSPLPHHEPGAGRGPEDVLHALARLGLIEEVLDGTAVLVHPVVADANRARLGSPTIPPDPDPDFVRDTAAVPLLRMLRKLDPTTPSHWPGYRRLAPHMLALLLTTGRHLSEDRLVSLLEAAGAVASAYDRAGAATAAMAMTGAALGLADRLGANHPAILVLRYDLALATGHRGRWKEAEAALHEVLEAQQLALGSDHRCTLETSHSLARALAMQGRWTEAEGAFRRVLAARERVLGADHPSTVATRDELVRAAAQRGTTERI